MTAGVMGCRRVKSSQVLTPQSCKEQGARIKKEGGMPRIRFRSHPVPPAEGSAPLVRSSSEVCMREDLVPRTKFHFTQAVCGIREQYSLERARGMGGESSMLTCASTALDPKSEKKKKRMCNTGSRPEQRAKTPPKSRFSAKIRK